MKVATILNEKLEEWLLSVGLITIVILVIAQSVSRYAFSFPIGWSEELVRFVFIWIAWISASYAVRENSHIRVEILKNMLPVQLKRITEIIVLIIWFSFALFLLVFGTKFIISVGGTEQISPSLGISMWIVYLAIPISGLLMGVRLVQQIVQVIRKKTI